VGITQPDVGWLLRLAPGSAYDSTEQLDRTTLQAEISTHTIYGRNPKEICHVGLFQPLRFLGRSPPTKESRFASLRFDVVPIQ
jgi:hypothetical protein